MLKKGIVLIALTISTLPALSFYWVPRSQIFFSYGIDYRFSPIWHTIELGFNTDAYRRHPLSYRNTYAQLSFSKDGRLVNFGYEGKLSLLKNHKRKIARYLYPIGGIHLNYFWNQYGEKSYSITPRFGIMYRSHFIRKQAHFHAKVTYGVSIPLDIRDLNHYNRQGFQILAGITFPVIMRQGFNWLRPNKEKATF